MSKPIGSGPRPRRRWIGLVAGGFFLALVAVALGLAAAPDAKGPVLTFGMDGTKHGSHPGSTGWVTLDTNSGLPDNFIALAFFTNKARVPLRLIYPMVHWEISNFGPTYGSAMWAGWGSNGPPTSVTLPPAGVATLPIGPPLPQYPPHPEFVPQRLRFEFDYAADAGFARRGLSQIFRRVPTRLMPKRAAGWLLRNGFMDGEWHRRFESDWQPCPFAKQG